MWIVRILQTTEKAKVAEPVGKTEKAKVAEPVGNSKQGVVSMKAASEFNLPKYTVAEIFMDAVSISLIQSMNHFEKSSVDEVNLGWRRCSI